MGCFCIHDGSNDCCLRNSGVERIMSNKYKLRIYTVGRKYRMKLPYQIVVYRGVEEKDGSHINVLKRVSLKTQGQINIFRMYLRYAQDLLRYDIEDFLALKNTYLENYHKQILEEEKTVILLSENDAEELSVFTKEQAIDHLKNHEHDTSMIDLTSLKS